MFERKWPRRAPPAQLEPLSRHDRSVTAHLRELLGDPPKIPPPSRSWQTEKTNGKALEGDGDGRCQGQASVTFQHQEIEELRAALRSCSSIQVLDATLTAARGKGRCPRESRRILKVLNAFWHSQGRRRRRSAMKLMSQVLRQEGEHRRFALADKGQRKKELFFTPRGVLRLERSDVSTKRCWPPRQSHCRKEK
eukprot:g913.t2